MRVTNWLRNILSALAASGLVGLDSSGAHAGPVIVLSGDGQASNEAVPSNHGSTAEVALTWSDNWDSYQNWPNDPGNGVYQHELATGTPVAATQTILFTPIASAYVTLNGFDANDWVGGPGGPSNTPNTVFNWSVLNGAGGTVLASATGLTVPDGTVLPIAINFVGAVGQALELNITQIDGSGSYFAIDNLAFSSTAVPEPGSLAVVGFGLGAMAMRRKRK